MKNIISIYNYGGIFWFRIFGKYGIHIKNTDKIPMLFSERNKLGNQIHISKYIIKFLK